MLELNEQLTVCGVVANPWDEGSWFPMLCTPAGILTFGDDPEEMYAFLDTVIEEPTPLYSIESLIGECVAIGCAGVVYSTQGLYFIDANGALRKGADCELTAENFAKSVVVDTTYDPDVTTNITELM